MNSKYYRENQCTCDILTFRYLMLLKWLWDWETFNSVMTEVPMISPVISIYWPPSQISLFSLNSLTNIIDPFTKPFDNYIIIGDFNLESSNKALKYFLDSNALHNLVKGHTCSKGKSSLVDLILTNRKFSFKNSQLFETGLTDHTAENYYSEI